MVPCLSVDGLTLFFVRNQQGRTDLWMSTRRGPAEKFEEPINLGPQVNRGQYNAGPSLSSDSRTLYFVSNCLGGRGVGDIWQAPLLPPGAPLPEPPIDEARWGQWEAIDRWTVPRFGVFAKHGEVKTFGGAADGGVLLPKGEFGTGAVWSGQCPSADYELSFELKPGATSVSFPVGTSQWGFAIGEGVAAAGPLRVTASVMYYYRGGCKAPFEKDKWHSVRLRVTARAVTCWIDGQERFSRDTAADPEKGIWDDGTTGPLAVYSWKDDGAARNIRLRRLDPGTPGPKK
jgi:hypothetical protein